MTFNLAIYVKRQNNYLVIVMRKSYIPEHLQIGEEIYPRNKYQK